MAKMKKIPLITIDKLRMGSDGEGVRSLIVAYGCPLNCRYCINDFCHTYPKDKLKHFSVEALFEFVNRYKIYYKATNGGVTFGGGEPLIYADFIFDFCSMYADKLSVNIETSLNVQVPYLEKLAEKINCFIVDIKDMNPLIYRKYTGVGNENLLANLYRLAPYADKVLIRVPKIINYNFDEDLDNSVKLLKEMGYTNFEFFNYVVRKDAEGAKLCLLRKELNQ